MSVQYPLKFEPILKERIWGGNKLNTILNKKTDKENIGESWELSDVKGDVSVVANGKFKGRSLAFLIDQYKDILLGKKVHKRFGKKFPLLIKFIDAKEALSIQLHPHDDLAKKRHDSFGKTEMWYVMQADAGANLIVGFKKDSNKEEYLKHLENKSLLEILNVDEVKKGDVYFIPTGRIHAIGAGVLLAEIQQTSDITYRIYDWDRKDDLGNGRELHTELALDAIDYKAADKYTTDYKSELNKSAAIVDCQYFTTNIIELDGKVAIDNSYKDSFVIYMSVEGNVVFNYNDDKEIRLNKGETILMPACLTHFSLKSDEKAEVLEVYIK
ncbi:type I phosphomannose isomerase catalytic subunit [Aureibaculum sp. 2210JD6-5]|uniref:type I phosphomannose isomerase catalytic subunit n=1 Tax=Aureibaculum sp. 2210JD6-5 TaxID=3103957 RepID=UPI002AACC844|nr:type I phosphomannose isomerase catalytic subunit [Aureibaculum sp. 2210JD6-5]MDY7393798.1 type I phosphomannose isomerase catalytic subunit [Aureibaculum sp. 2210JD6-5]